MGIKAVIALSMITAAALITPGETLGGPSNGTRFPPARSVELGYEYNSVFSRPIGRSCGEIRTQDHFYTVSYGVTDWFVFDGKAGLGDVTHRGADYLPLLEYDTGFAGGYGFRALIFDYTPWCARVIAGFQHISVHPQDASADNDKYESFLDDWQVSGLIAKDMSFLTAYIGMKGSDCEIVYKLNKHDKKRRYSEYHIGLVVGIEAYLFERKARLGVEGRFFDETALSASVAYLF